MEVGLERSLFSSGHNNVCLRSRPTYTTSVRSMVRRLELVVLLGLLITVTSTSSPCTLDVSYVLCNGVSINILRAGRYPINTTTVTAVHFNNNNLTDLEENVFRSIRNLKYIVIIHNLIQSLQSNLFFSLGELVHIDLSNNRIVYVGKNLFTSQGKLQYLLLRYNQITTLDSNIFVPLISLKILDISSNPFECNCQLLNVIIWYQNRNPTDRATCSNGTELMFLTSSKLCAPAVKYTSPSITSTERSDQVLTYESVYNRESVEQFTTESTLNNTYYKARPFSKEQILTFVGVVIVLILCAIIGIYLWIRSKRLNVSGRNKTMYVGGTDTEDCREEFVASRRLPSYLEGGSLSHVPLVDDSSPECEELRRPSESDSDGSVFLYTPKLSPVEKKIPELPDLAAYSVPFCRENSPAPVYAVPFNEESSNTVREDGRNIYSMPNVQPKKKRNGK